MARPKKGCKSKTVLAFELAESTGCTDYAACQQIGITQANLTVYRRTHCKPCPGTANAVKRFFEGGWGAVLAAARIEYPYDTPEFCEAIAKKALLSELNVDIIR